MSGHRQSDFIIDTRDLGRQPGNLRQYRLDFALPAAMGNEVIGLDAGAQIQIQVQLQSVQEGVLASGTIFGVAQGECARCADPISQELAVEFQELYFYAEGRSAQQSAQINGATEADEIYAVLNGGLLDLEQTVIDAVVVDLPLIPLCTPDCHGVDVYGNRLSSPAAPDIDPRLAKLAELKLQ